MRGLSTFDEDRLQELEELRLRRGFPMTALFPEGEIETVGARVTEADLRRVVESASYIGAHRVRPYAPRVCHPAGRTSYRAVRHGG